MSMNAFLETRKSLQILWANYNGCIQLHPKWWFNMVSSRLGFSKGDAPKITSKDDLGIINWMNKLSRPWRGDLAVKPRLLRGFLGWNLLQKTHNGTWKSSYKWTKNLTSSSGKPPPFLGGNIIFLHFLLGWLRKHPVLPCLVWVRKHSVVPLSAGRGKPPPICAAFVHQRSESKGFSRWSTYSFVADRAWSVFEKNHGLVWRKPHVV